MMNVTRGGNPPIEATFDENCLSRLLETHDPAVLEELYRMYLEQSLPIVEELASFNAIDRLDSPAALFEVQGLAHRLKSSARSVGAIGMGAILEWIELAAAEARAEAVCQGLAELEQVHRETVEQVKSRLERLR